MNNDLQALLCVNSSRRDVYPKDKIFTPEVYLKIQFLRTPTYTSFSLAELSVTFQGIIPFILRITILKAKKDLK